MWYLEKDLSVLEDMQKGSWENQIQVITQMEFVFLFYWIFWVFVFTKPKSKRLDPEEYMNNNILVNTFVFSGMCF